MFRTTLTPPTFDQATIDYFVAKGNSVRSRAVVEMVRHLFKAPQPDHGVGANCSA